MLNIDTGIVKVILYKAARIIIAKTGEQPDIYAKSLQNDSLIRRITADTQQNFLSLLRLFGKRCRQIRSANQNIYT